MLSEQLKTETAQQHVALERLVIPTIKSIKSFDDYKRLLQLFYGYYQPVETAIDNHINILDLPDYAERRKAILIKQDLESIKETAFNLPLCNDLPTITNMSEALGAMYVLEGSTLGGKFIGKMIAKQLDVNNNDSIQFFSAYGDEVEEKWYSFKNHIDLYTSNADVSKQVISAANDTFLKFKEWIVAN